MLVHDRANHWPGIDRRTLRLFLERDTKDACVVHRFKYSIQKILQRGFDLLLMIQNHHPALICVGFGNALPDCRLTTEHMIGFASPSATKFPVRACRTCAAFFTLQGRMMRLRCSILREKSASK